MSLPNQQPRSKLPPSSDSPYPSREILTNRSPRAPDWNRNTAAYLRLPLTAVATHQTAGIRSNLEVFAPSFVLGGAVAESIFSIRGPPAIPSPSASTIPATRAVSARFCSAAAQQSALPSVPSRAAQNVNNPSRQPLARRLHLVSCSIKIGTYASSIVSTVRQVE